MKQEGHDIKKGVKSLGPAPKNAAPRGRKKALKPPATKPKEVTREMKHDVKRDLREKKKETVKSFVRKNNACAEVKILNHIKRHSKSSSLMIHPLVMCCSNKKIEKTPLFFTGLFLSFSLKIPSKKAKTLPGLV